MYSDVFCLRLLLDIEVHVAYLAFYQALCQQTNARFVMFLLS